LGGFAGTPPTGYAGTRKAGSFIDEPGRESMAYPGREQKLRRFFYRVLKLLLLVLLIYLLWRWLTH